MGRTKLKVLDLFSGIGGFSLGLERTGGFETVAFCEIDPFCRRVLAKHWPEVKQYDDVRTLTADQLAADGIAVDVICGGFPCQDISLAGLELGMEGERSGLWSEIARLSSELRPQFLLVENVTNLLAGERGAWFSRVLGDLAAIGYDAEWHCISASDFAAPHRRSRVWIVANPHGNSHPDFGAAAAKFPFSEGIEGWGRRLDELGPSDGLQRDSSYAGIRRAVHGIPDWAHRLRALGNAVVPQIPELIGNAILESMRIAA
jgi:DNA (cytosine-5)-methyltransferase 1